MLKECKGNIAIACKVLLTSFQTTNRFEGWKKKMSLFTATGNEAMESATAKRVDFEKAYIRLKADDSVRVRLLGILDSTVAEYNAHGDFEKKIYTAPCIAPTGAECPYCVASKSGVDGWDKFYARKRYLIAFYDIDNATVRVWDASKQQGEGMLKMMEEYDGSKDDLAFNFKRTGAGASDTAYHLMPILKLDATGKELFEAGAGVEVEPDFFGTVLVARTREQMLENLANADFPVADFFDDAVKVSSGEEGTGDIDEEEAESIADESIANM